MTDHTTPTPRQDAPALAQRMAAALTAVTFDCDGMCGLTPEACMRMHGIADAGRSGGVPHVEGPVPVIAAVCAAVAAGQAPQEPDDFYRPGHIYGGRFGWRFRCDMITTDPDHGDLVATGWRYFEGCWEVYAYYEEDWEVQEDLGVCCEEECPGCVAERLAAKALAAPQEPEPEAGR